MLGLMVGLDAAMKTRSQLALADGFWSRNPNPADRRGFGPYPWAWDVLPFSKASHVAGCSKQATDWNGDASVGSWFAAWRPGRCNCAQVNPFRQRSCGGKWCAEGAHGVYLRGVHALRPRRRTVIDL